MMVPLMLSEGRVQREHDNLTQNVEEDGKDDQFDTAENVCNLCGSRLDTSGSVGD